MSEITKTLRFTIPPFIFVFFTILAYLINSNFIILPQQAKVFFQGGISNVVTSTMGIVALGFLFTSFTSYISRKKGWMSPKWKDNQQEILKKVTGLSADINISTFKNEFLEWLALVQDEVPQRVRDNIQKRWEWFQIYISSIVALLFSVVYMVILNFSEINKMFQCEICSQNFMIYILIILVFYYLFYRNAKDNYSNVYEADNLVLAYLNQPLDHDKISPKSIPHAAGLASNEKVYDKNHRQKDNQPGVEG